MTERPPGWISRRGARVERRKAERATRSAPPPGPAVMRIPDAIRNLTEPKEDDRG